MRDADSQVHSESPNLSGVAHRSSVFITGASSGIGQALAYEFARRGYHLALAARRIDALNALSESLQTQFPKLKVFTYQLDVTDYDEVFATIDRSAQDLSALDIVIANAGTLDRGRVGHGHFAKHRNTIETNVLGAMATCDAAIKLFRRRQRGQLVVMSSVAAFRGLPGSAAYGASKAAITTYADAVRAELHGTPISVTTIFPGFIDTPINQDVPHRPFLITAERGAKLIVDKIERRVQRAIVPALPWVLIKWFANWIPTSLVARSRRS